MQENTQNLTQCSWAWGKGRSPVGSGEIFHGLWLEQCATGGVAKSVQRANSCNACCTAQVLKISIIVVILFKTAWHCASFLFFGSLYMIFLFFIFLAFFYPVWRSTLKPTTGNCPSANRRAEPSRAVLATQSVFLPLIFWDGESSFILAVYPSIAFSVALVVFGEYGSFGLIPSLFHLRQSVNRDYLQCDTCETPLPVMSFSRRMRTADLTFGSL